METSFLENEIYLVLTLGIVIMVALALAVVLIFNRSQQRILQEKNHTQQLQLSYQKELLHSVIKTQERERKRIAKDLHDDIGSKLNVVLLNLHRLGRLNEKPEQQKEMVAGVQDLIHTTINTTRRISHDLLPPVLEDFGFLEALKELSEHYEQSGSLAIQLDLKQTPQPLPDKLMELNLFRVFQELMKNSVQHGKAKVIKIKGTLTEDFIDLSYSDDGIGFDRKKQEQKRKGLGMQNLQSRLEMINASLDFRSVPGDGVNVRIRKNQLQEPLPHQPFN